MEHMPEWSGALSLDGDGGSGMWSRREALSSRLSPARMEGPFFFNIDIYIYIYIPFSASSFDSLTSSF